MELRPKSVGVLTKNSMTFAPKLYDFLPKTVGVFERFCIILITNRLQRRQKVDVKGFSRGNYADTILSTFALILHFQLPLPLRISYTGVVDCHEPFYEDLLGIRDVAEAYRALVVELLCHLRIDYAVDKFGNGLLGIVGK